MKASGMLPAACALALLGLCRSGLADPKLSDFKSAEDRLTLKPGEKLVYSVRWMKLPVGKAVLHVKDIIDVDGTPAYQITTYTKANRLIRLIYKVDDKVTSYVAVEGFRPLKFQKRLREGRRKKDELIDFDWERKEATYYEGKGEKQKKRRTIPITEGTQDTLSCIYFLRSLPLQIGKECTMRVATEKKCWDVVITPIKKTKINLRNAGKFDALLIEPTVDFEGLFVHDRKLRIWLEEETKIPLMMVADIPIGSIVLVLSEIADTKAPPQEEPAKGVEARVEPWEPAGRRKEPARGDEKRVKR